MFDFSNQRVIVTGGTRGIGAGISLAFLQAGAMVISTYSFNDDAANEFKNKNEQYSSRLDIQKYDVSSSKEVKNFFKYLDEKYPSLEVLVNNSGVRQDAIAALMSDEQWEKVLDVNLTGTFYMSREIIPRFMANRFGRIINISSLGADIGFQGQANYAASKAGQLALTKSLSKEVAKKGITVNCVTPGFIDTELISDLPEEQRKEYLKMIPQKRFGKVEEVAYAVMFLATREASYINGTSITVAGGL
ncbi:3-oxoacyl-acp reductase [hydrocarbon metagenome]|uniref:3-oxoacyl-acp reductase n=1 Tax=hydrocarbon metagenome TaxID=938273 RepID=A0A0W8FT82_9ZZZZ